jgi:hypothetical protein
MDLKGMWFECLDLIKLADDISVGGVFASTALNL